MSLIKSKKRVADHGGSIHALWLVDAMLDLVKDEAERIDSVSSEPACGQRQLSGARAATQAGRRGNQIRQSDFEKRHYSLYARSCALTGSSFCPDNIAECRANMLDVLAEYLNIDEADEAYRAASYVLAQNLVHGDALTMRTRTAASRSPLPNGGYLGKGKFQRRDFRSGCPDRLIRFQRRGRCSPIWQQARDLHARPSTWPAMTLRDLAAAHDGTPAGDAA